MRSCCIFEHSAAMRVIAVIGALMTAFYMFRLIYMAFFRKFRGTETQMQHLHESPAVMTVPLIILAFLAAFGGLLNIPEVFEGSSRLSAFLAPVFADAAAVTALPQPPSHATAAHGCRPGGCLVMIWLGLAPVCKVDKGLLPDNAPRSFPVKLLSGKYFIDELYDFPFVKPSTAISRFLHDVVELRFIDRIVNGIGR